MFEQTFKNIDDILHKDAGCSSELDYVEQTSWILFLKYLDDYEKDKKTARWKNAYGHGGHGEVGVFSNGIIRRYACGYFRLTGRDKKSNRGGIRTNGRFCSGCSYGLRP